MREKLSLKIYLKKTNKRMKFQKNKNKIMNLYNKYKNFQKMKNKYY